MEVQNWQSVGKELGASLPMPYILLYKRNIKNGPMTGGKICLTLVQNQNLGKKRRRKQPRSPYGAESLLLMMTPLY